ncbi:hypothetical protein M5K25_024581 [Dendrobium thyrsiflorum]|uniref:Reverse transcriptase zinc-binding domain-containing protein n=1 Tax=Dendrobium thyrsiflorum TaxID=117978 RepID=A0ABD0U2C7_DENTH
MSKGNIKFEDVWASIPASVAVVREAWRKKTFGSLSQILNYKMRRALKALFYWSKAKLKSLNLSKEILKREIVELQEKEAELGCLLDDDSWLLKVKLNELNSTLARLNTWWKQCAKVKWLAEGDRNSRFFQSFASAQRSSNFIFKIKDDNGLLVKDQHQIEDVLFRFFKEKWKDRSCSLDGWPYSRTRLDVDDVRMLSKEFSLDEVEIAIKQAGGNISPRNDDITYSFIKSYWSIIKEDFWNAIHNFLLSGKMCVLHEMDKLCRSFIWSKRNGGAGLHYVNWDMMCRPVNCGGRGLFSCSNKVGPLRAKLAWKYDQDKDSLVHKALFPKYGSLYEADVSKKACSTAWKLIFNGGRFLKPIVRWNIANDRSIDVFKDTWIMDKCISRWPTFVKSPGNDELTVDLFISNGCWDVIELYEFFGKDLVDLISKIQIMPDLLEGRMELIHQNSGKSISAMATAALVCDQSGFQNWDWLKKAKLIPRVETFWWRILNNAIPTNHFLSYRRLHENNHCPRSCDEVEDIDHVVTRCKNLKEAVQHLNNWGFGIPTFVFLEDCCRWLACQNYWLAKLFCNTVFFSWKSRNELVHGGNEGSPLMIAANSVSYAADPTSYYCFNSGHWDANQPRLLNRWHPPPPDWIKVNVDASLLPSYKAGIAGVFRDYNGRFPLAFGHACVHWDVSRLELLAIQSIKDVITDWMFNYKGLIIEGDNINIIKFLLDAVRRGGQDLGELTFIKDFNYRMAESWSAPFLEILDASTNVQVYEVSFIESWLFLLNPMKNIFLKIARSSSNPLRRIAYSFGDHYDLRKELQILNLLTGYIFLLDRHGRIRWQGFGSATTEEVSSLLSCATLLLEE